jgi:hypothetical protein
MSFHRSASNTVPISSPDYSFARAAEVVGSTGLPRAASAHLSYEGGPAPKRQRVSDEGDGQRQRISVSALVSPDRVQSDHLNLPPILGKPLGDPASLLPVLQPPIVNTDWELVLERQARMRSEVSPPGNLASDLREDLAPPIASLPPSGPGALGTLPGISSILSLVPQAQPQAQQTHELSLVSQQPMVQHHPVSVKVTPIDNGTYLNNLVGRLSSNDKNILHEILKFKKEDIERQTPPAPKNRLELRRKCSEFCTPNEFRNLLRLGREIRNFNGANPNCNIEVNPAEENHASVTPS